MDQGFYILLVLSLLLIGVPVVVIGINWVRVPESEINLLVAQYGLTRISKADITTIRSKTFWLFNDLNVGHFRIYADGEDMKLAVFINRRSGPRAIVYCPIDHKHSRLRYGKVNDYAKPTFFYGNTQDEVLTKIVRSSETLNLGGIEIADGGMLLWGMSGQLEGSLSDCLRLLSGNGLLPGNRVNDQKAK